MRFPLFLELLSLVKFKEELGKFLLGMKEKAYYSSRSFDEVVASKALKTVPVTSEHRALLAKRRAKGERPGAGLLERDENEMKVAQREASALQSEHSAQQLEASARDRDAALERLVRTAPWGTAASTPFAFL